MKKKVIFIIGFILGGLLFGIVGVYATLSYSANQITYTKGNNTIYLSEAIDELYTTQGTTVNNLQTDLNTCNSRSFLVRDIVNPGTNTVHHLWDMTNANGYSKFIVKLNSKGTNAACTIYTTNGGSTKIADLSLDTEYSTTYGNVVDYRLNLKAETSWCSYKLIFYN